jgi:hypothetical protein
MAVRDKTGDHGAICQRRAIRFRAARRLDSLRYISEEDV